MENGSGGYSIYILEAFFHYGRICCLPLTTAALSYSPKNLRYFKESRTKCNRNHYSTPNIYMQNAIRPIHPWIHNIAYK